MAQQTKLVTGTTKQTNTDLLSNVIIATQNTPQIKRKIKQMSKMSIYSVKLYKLNNIQWVFDDPNKKIIAEAFVAGADTMLDKITGGYNPDLAYTLQFSTKDYPGSKMITLIHEQDAIHDKRVPDVTHTGSWWECKEDNHVMWLCDTLDEYIEIENEELYFSVNIGKKNEVFDYELCI